MRVRKAAIAEFTRTRNRRDAMAKANEQAKTIRLRTCVSCGGKEDKRGLLRLVRKADGSVGFDPTGRCPGRGAYVCSFACFKRAVAGKRLNRALKTRISEEDYAQIADELGRLTNRVDG